GFGAGGGEFGGVAIDGAAADHHSADLREFDRRRIAGLRVCDAGGERFADFGAADGLLSDHQGNTRHFATAGGWNVRGGGAGGVGNGAVDVDDPECECVPWKEAGRDFSDLASFDVEVPHGRAPHAGRLNSARFAHTLWGN